MRTRDGILAAIAESTEEPVKITRADADVLVAGHIEHRRGTSGRSPQRDFVDRKLSSDFRICGKRVIVEG